ncbi:hypothetical protein J3A83DRAFT_4362985 [Scleroderma citrinum]
MIGQTSIEEETASQDSTLPTPATFSPQKSRPKVSAAAIIPVWIVLSSAAVGTRVLQRTTHLLDSAKDVHMSKHVFLRSIFPIGLLFSGSLILSNTAYLYLNVAYIQMLKVTVAILLISWVTRIRERNRKPMVIALMIALASHGELHFHLYGFLVQAAAVLRSFPLRNSPSPSAWIENGPSRLHYYTPVCAVINLAVIPFTMGLAPFYDLARLGPVILISNAIVEFLLNVAAVFLVSAASGLVLTLAGVFKVGYRSPSVLLYEAPIIPLQILGYSVALSGLVLSKCFVSH